jgi:predicted alpha/beta-hydrolase family hydrolase
MGVVHDARRSIDAANHKKVALQRGGPCVRTRALSSRAMQAEPVSFEVEGGAPAKGLLLRPPRAVACYVMAHGAGAGMEHPFMAACAHELAERGIATLRYQFPYMQRGGRRTDPPGVCHAVVRGAVAFASTMQPGLPLIAGGRSFGGRMTSQAQALAALPGVRGLAFLAFPLHVAKKPSDARAKHLSDVTIPMLFLQGTRDELASLDLLQALVERLGCRATLHLAEGADHAFHVLARSGRTDLGVRAELIDALVGWAERIAPAERG